MARMFHLIAILVIFFQIVRSVDLPAPVSQIRLVCEGESLDQTLSAILTLSQQFHEMKSRMAAIETENSELKLSVGSVQGDAASAKTVLALSTSLQKLTRDHAMTQVSLRSFKQQYVALSNQVSRLNDKFEILQGNTTAHQASIRKLESGKIVLESKHEKLNEGVLSMGDSITELKAQKSLLDQLTSKVELQNQHKLVLEDSVGSLKSEIQSELEKLNNRIKNTSQTSGKRLVALESLTSNVSGNAVMLEDLKRNIYVNISLLFENQENLTYKFKNEVMETVANTTYSTKRDLQNHRLATYAMNKTLQEMLQDLQLKDEEQNGSINVLREDDKLASSNLKSAQGLLTKLKSDFQTLQSNHSNLRVAVDALGMQNGSLISDITKISTQNKDMFAMLDSVIENNIATNVTVSGLKNEIASTKFDVNNLGQFTTQSQSNLDNLNSRVTSMDEQKQSQIDTIVSQIGSMNSSVRSRTDLLDSKMDDMNSDISTRMDSLKLKTANIEGNVSTLFMQAKALGINIKITAASIKDVNETVGTSLSRIVNQELKLKALNESLNQSHNQLSDSIGKLNSNAAQIQTDMSALNLKSNTTLMGLMVAQERKLSALNASSREAFKLIKLHSADIGNLNQSVESAFSKINEIEEDADAQSRSAMQLINKSYESNLLAISEIKLDNDKALKVAERNNSNIQIRLTNEEKQTVATQIELNSLKKDLIVGQERTLSALNESSREAFKFIKLQGEDIGNLNQSVESAFSKINEIKEDAVAQSRSAMQLINKSYESNLLAISEIKLDNDKFLKVAERNNSNIQIRLTKEEKQTVTMQTELNSLKKDVFPSQITTEIRVLKRTYAQMQENVDLFQDLLQNIKENIAENLTEINLALQESTESLELDLDTLKKSASTIETTVESNLATLADLKSRSSATETTAESNSAILADLRSNSSATEKKVESNSASLAELKSRSSATETTVELHSSSLSDLKSRSSALETTVESNSASYADLTSRSSATETSVESNSAKLADLRSKGSATEAAVKNNSLLIGNVQRDTAHLVANTDKANVAFMATQISSRIKGDENPVTWKYDQLETNIGEAFNQDTGIFTAPYKAAYQFTANARDNSGNRLPQFAIYRTDTIVARTYQQIGGAMGSHSISVVLELERGDTVQVKSEHSIYSYWFDDPMAFSGYMLFKM